MSTRVVLELQDDEVRILRGALDDYLVANRFAADRELYPRGERTLDPARERRAKEYRRRVGLTRALLDQIPNLAPLLAPSNGA